MTTDAPIIPAPIDTELTKTWFITFGLGTRHGRTHTRVLVPASLSRDEASDYVRSVAVESYGTEWAFHYSPDQYESAIAQYHLTVRETL